MGQSHINRVFLGYTTQVFGQIASQQVYALKKNLDRYLFCSFCILLQYSKKLVTGHHFLLATIDKMLYTHHIKHGRS